MEAGQPLLFLSTVGIARSIQPDDGQIAGWNHPLGRPGNVICKDEGPVSNFPVLINVWRSPEYLRVSTSGGYELPRCLGQFLLLRRDLLPHFAGPNSGFPNWDCVHSMHHLFASTHMRTPRAIGRGNLNIWVVVLPMGYWPLL